MIIYPPKLSPIYSDRDTHNPTRYTLAVVYHHPAKPEADLIDEQATWHSDSQALLKSVFIQKLAQELSFRDNEGKPFRIFTSATLYRRLPHSLKLEEMQNWGLDEIADIMEQLQPTPSDPDESDESDPAQTPALQ